MQTDVFVAGGGPAGLAAAIAARQKGLRVVVADCALPPIDKVCGEGLMPDGVAALSKLGVKVGCHQAVRFRGIRFVKGEASVVAAFPNGCGLGIRRTTLHHVLVERAVEAGVSLLWGTTLLGISPDRVRLDGGAIRCRWIIAADGQNSQVRKWAGLDRIRHEQIRFGFRRHYRITPWTDFVEVHWGHKCQVVVTPVGPEEVCFTLISGSARLRLENALPLFPGLAKRLNGAPATTTERGAISVLRSIRVVSRGRVALVGDASGSVDAITGEGLCLAFQQAVFLAEALAHNDLSPYQAAHRRLARLPNWMSRLMLFMDKHEGLQRSAMRALVKEPHLFSRLLATHVGAPTPVAIGISGALRLGWRLLTGWT